MDLIQSIREAGIVGAGGAGFPTHVKLASKAEYVILNGAECEPLLRVDQQLIVKFAEQIIEGLEKVAELVEAKKVYIGIKAKHKEEALFLKEKLKGNSIVELFELDDFYPAGDEQALVNEVTKRVVPEAGIPLKVGCIVTNVETVLNIMESLSGKAVTHTYLTITGKVSKPITLKLPIGITYREAVEIAGIKDTRGLVFIDGGPMMGKIKTNFDEPITKTTKGIIVLDEDHYLIRKKSMSTTMALKQSKAACLQCRMCTELCPRYLLGHNMQPHLMMRMSNYDHDNLNKAETASLCCECSVCELYACPAGLSPRLINIHYKQKLSEKGKRYAPSKVTFETLTSRDYRKIPVKRLIVKLGLKEYDVKAPMEEVEYFPQRVKISLKQHIGAPSVPVVEVGQRVSQGELIGEIPEKAMGARVHSSISGVVKEISNYIEIESI
ncbi:4Fe-4S dicluster domain-containing protein [Clostridium sp. PL3]|uniref:4Fe-4S dicluster domain-containing protein n=1 Tax=Clostridium thailandense TaxID=2794346 RepID=A0A949TVX3_9CLOT|nr:4Fe-4S dicluster domain-containing protein [Clostridium thailandense]MBV7271319.1 4Fe-4S dicluster domain-containing protein [Clostridium thailandense]